MISRKEIKLFIIFWIIYIFYAHWVGWAEYSLYDLTMAISNELRFEIDSFYNNTGDRSFYNGHYYSNKNPGASFLNLFPYSTLKFWYSKLPFPKNNSQNFIWKEDVRTVTEYGESTTYFLVNPGKFNQYAQWSSIIFTTAFLSSLSVLLMYKISKAFKLEEKKRKLICIGFGLGTMIFPFACNFFQHAFGMFFGFLSFFFLFTRGEKLLYHFLGGVSLGYAIVCDGNFFYLFLPFFFYSLAKFRKLNLFIALLAGMLVGVCPLLVYNYYIFGYPFGSIYYYSDLTIRTDIQKEFGFHFPNIFLMYRHTFDTFRGLFIFNPILILSLLGIPLMYRNFKEETIFILVFYLSQLIFYSSFNTDFSFGSSFGPRQYLPSIPFLMLSIIPLLKKRYTYQIFLLLLFPSIFINTLSIFDWENLLIDPSAHTLIIDKHYWEIATTSFKPLRNPLIEHYIPLFLKHGFKLRTIDGLLGNNINLRIQHEGGFSFDGLAVLLLIMFIFT